jgi:hypothetical protein
MNPMPAVGFMPMLADAPRFGQPTLYFPPESSEEFRGTWIAPFGPNVLRPESLNSLFFDRLDSELVRWEPRDDFTANGNVVVHFPEVAEPTSEESTQVVSLAEIELLAFYAKIAVRVLELKLDEVLARGTSRALEHTRGAPLRQESHLKLAGWRLREPN